METLTRLVSESLARHGFDRPVDYRRLQWSRWFRCESHHSLLIVPSKPGVFALAEEITRVGTAHVGTAASAVQRSGASSLVPVAESPEPKTEPGRMLAVSHFFEDEDMAFVLDRMLSYENPIRARLASGRYFVRFVVIEDASQRRSICNALNQWIVSSAEKATGIGPHFATSLELPSAVEPILVATAATPTRSVVDGAVARTLSEAEGSSTGNNLSNAAPGDQRTVNTAPTLNSAVDTNIHCSSSFPSGF